MDGNPATWIKDRDYKMLDPLRGARACAYRFEDTHQRLLKVWEEAEGHGGDLTPLGVRQHRGIAERMYASFRRYSRQSLYICPFYRCIALMQVWWLW